MTELDPRLIAELARLAPRYPAQQWKLLAEWVDDEDKRRELGLLLREIADASRAPRRRPNRKRAKAHSHAQKLRAAIDAVRDDDPHRAEILEQAWDQLRSREVLPTLAALRSFVAAAGLNDLKSSRRDQATTELMEQLVTMSQADLDNVTFAVPEDGRSLGEEYERWFHLILDRKPDDCID